MLTGINLRTNAFIIIFFIIFIFVCAGCVSGLVYKNVTVPLSTDMDRTPRSSRVCSVNTKLLQEPVTGFDISIEWDSRAIGDAARRCELETIYFADIHTISILGGLWKQQIVHVCGK